MNKDFNNRWHDFWFRPVSAAGFGMMRVGFGLTAFLTMLLQYTNVELYYGPYGLLPRDVVPVVLREQYRFSLLDHVGLGGTWFLYWLLLVSLLLVTLGIGRKIPLLVSVILLYSFHEYGSVTLDGGDTLMRLLGFILLLSPCYRTFSIDNARRRLKLIRETGKDQPVSARTMPIWPYRLLLWQMILMYTASSMEKWIGRTWHEGSAVAITLHHTNFSRLSPAAADALSYMSAVIGYFTVLSQAAWFLLLPFGLLTMLCILNTTVTNAFKRALILCGIVIHGAIFILMDVGTFSLTVFVAYLGLLIDDDFRAMRRRLNAHRTQPIVVLYDGRCGFCKKSIFVLSLLDFLHRLQFANFHDPDLRKRYAPDVNLDDLHKELHIRLPDGGYQKGFYAFRRMAWHLPFLWPLAPLLHVPGVSALGEKAYAFVANHRS
jgi:predicted DCC family thiol-disulfide oxidoreductase YuxK